MLEQPGDELQRFLEEIRRPCFEARPAQNTLCREKSLAVEGGARLHELEGRTEVTPSKRLEVIGRLGAIGCRGASWSEQLDGNFA